MDEEAYTTQLTTLGLSPYEARAYLTLVQDGALTAEEVAAASDVPRGRIYDVLNALDDRSLVHADDGRPRTYTHVEPPVAVDRLLERRLTELEEKQQSFEQTATDAATALQSLEQPSEKDRFATSALEEEAAISLLLERFGAAETSLRIYENEVTPYTEVNEQVSDSLEQLLEAGVTIELLASNFSQHTDQLEELLEAGMAVRRTAYVPNQRFIVIDDIEVCLEVVHPIADEELLAVVNFRDEEIAAGLAASFDELWAAAEAWSPTH